MQLERHEVWRAKGANHRAYEAEAIPTSQGQDRWHVSVVDPVPADLDYADQPMTLYRETGAEESGIIRTLDEAQAVIENYEARAVERMTAEHERHAAGRAPHAPVRSDDDPAGAARPPRQGGYADVPTPPARPRAGATDRGRETRPIEPSR